MLNLKKSPKTASLLSLFKRQQTTARKGGLSNNPTLPLRTSNSIPASVTAANCNCNSNRSTATKDQ